ncbi:unnamed protein product [Closterium sp. NIES-53]
MLALCQEHRLEHRTKHIALRYFLAQELQQRGQLHLAYVASRANTADVFTKALQPCDHQPCFTFLTGLVLQRFGFQFSSPQPTPLSTDHSLSAPPSDESVEPSGPYPELVGCLMYLMTCTQPDLASQPSGSLRGSRSTPKAVRSRSTLGPWLLRIYAWVDAESSTQEASA